MTTQRKDTIIVKKKSYQLYGLPLAQYFEKFEHNISLLGGTTSLWRGYYAHWAIKKQKLFLINFWGENFLTQKEYNLKDLFPNQVCVFASWYTGDLEIPITAKENNLPSQFVSPNENYRAVIMVSKGHITHTLFKDISV